MNGSIRAVYEQIGVGQYYSGYADKYCNPHQFDVLACVNTAVELISPIKTALDLGCGDGLVSRSLNGVRVVGCDPYMNKVYERHTGNKCYSLSFKELATAGLPDDVQFDAIFCSYSLHLAEKSLLPVIEYQLSCASKWLVIISPHKNPKIEKFWTSVFETTINHARLRIYLKK